MSPFLRLLAGPAALSLAGLSQASAQPVPPPPPAPVYGAAPSAPPPVPQRAEPPAGSVVLPPGTTAAGAQHAVLDALQHRGWQVVSVGPDTIVARLIRRGLDSVVTIPYGPYRVDLYARAYRMGSRGEEWEAPFTRLDWIRYLEKDITSFIRRRPQG